MSHLYLLLPRQRWCTDDHSGQQRPPWAVDMLRQKIVNNNQQWWCVDCKLCANIPFSSEPLDHRCYTGNIFLPPVVTPTSSDRGKIKECLFSPNDGKSSSLSGRGGLEGCSGWLRKGRGGKQPGWCTAVMRKTPLPVLPVLHWAPTSLHSPPSAPEWSRLRRFRARTVRTSGTRMEKSHRHGDTGSSVPENTHTHIDTHSQCDHNTEQILLTILESQADSFSIELEPWPYHYRDAHDESMKISGELLNVWEHASVHCEGPSDWLPRAQGSCGYMDISTTTSVNK